VISVADVVPNEELRALLLRMYQIWEAKDIRAMVDLFSRQACLLTAGPEPEECLTGTDAVNVFAAQARLMPRWTVKRCEPRAYSCGGVGWVSDELHIAVGELFEFHGRLTATLVIEDGHWRIIQYHLSVPRTFGDVLPKSIDQVEHFVREAQPELATSAAPDGTVTVVFTDMESSATLLERLGDAQFMQMLAWHDRIVRDTVAQHHGYVVKAEGDGFMLAFASAASALRSCLVTRERLASGYRDLPIRVRAGLHTGEAIRRDDDFYGRTVVIAARISTLALGGEILASDLVRALTQGLGTFTFGEARTTMLKGLQGTFDIYPVLT
jgi:class 3 adenylate cyclase